MKTNPYLLRISFLYGLILIVSIHTGLSQETQIKESYHLSTRQISLQVGSGLVPVRFPREVRDLDISLNGAIQFRGFNPSGIQLGAFFDYQQRAGHFVFYRLLPTAGGTLQKEIYDVGGQHLSIGAKASLPLNQMFASATGIQLPTWLELYQSFFVGVVRTDILLPENLEQLGVITGFGSDMGVSEFPDYGEDIQLILGTTVGMKVHIPSTSLSLFSEFGLGPLSSVNVGIASQIKYGKRIDAVKDKD